MSFNITLQNVANFCSTHADLLPMSGIGGYTEEPFLSIANDAISDLFSAPNDWKFNRQEMAMLVTAPQKQDYLFAGATAFSLGATAQGWAIATGNAITLTGSGSPPVATLVTVTTLEPHRFAIGDTVYLNGVVATIGTTSAYTSVFTDTGSATAWTNSWVITAITAKSFSFLPTAGQNFGDIAGAPGITNFGWGTSASMVQMVNVSSPQFVQDLKVYRELNVTSRVGQPENVSVIADLGGGVLKIRFFLIPGSTSWGAKIVYQAAAPVKQSLADKWDPIPDSYSALYRQAVIYRMYRFLNSPLMDKEYAKLQQEIQRFQGGDSAEETDVSLVPDEPLMSSDGWGW